MKKLSLVFGVIGILFMLLGLYELFNLSELNLNLVLCFFMLGFMSTALFIIINNLSDKMK